MERYLASVFSRSCRMFLPTRFAKNRKALVVIPAATQHNAESDTESISQRHQRKRFDILLNRFVIISAIIAILPMEEGNGIDLYNRDPNDLSLHLQVSWSDLVAEPDEFHSADYVWTRSNWLFQRSRVCCYYVLTAIFFAPISVCIGCKFACLAFQHTWCVRPCIRDLKINCHAVRKMVFLCCDGLMGPFFEAIGLVFSRFKFVFVSMKQTKKVFTGASAAAVESM